MHQLVYSLIFHYILPYSTCNFYIKWLAVCEGRTRWKMIHKDIMFPHPKDASFFSPPPSYYNVSGYPVLSYFFLTVYSILTMLFAETKNCSYSERLCFKLCFHFKHATVYKLFLANVFLQSILTYGPQIKNYTILTKTVGTVEIKYCSTEKNFQSYVYCQSRRLRAMCYQVNYFIFSAIYLIWFPLELVVFGLLFHSF